MYARDGGFLLGFGREVAQKRWLAVFGPFEKGGEGDFLSRLENKKVFSFPLRGTIAFKSVSVEVDSENDLAPMTADVEHGAVGQADRLLPMYEEGMVVWNIAVPFSTFLHHG